MEDKRYTIKTAMELSNEIFDFIKPVAELHKI
jgi:hypothetical protein